MMKGQFFIIASVIIVFSLAGLITYLYDFGSVDLTRIGEMKVFDQIPQIKKSLNNTIYSSYSSNDCNKITMDLDSSIDYMKTELLKNGITFSVSYDMTCALPNLDVDINYNIRKKNLYTNTSFSVSIT